MKIKNLEIENFRGFNGKHEINFSVKEDKPVTLILAENGTGKSNILEAIQWCLHGTMPPCDDPDSIINKQARQKNKQKTHASVRLTIIDDAESQITGKQKPEYVISRIINKDKDLVEPEVWEKDENRKGGLRKHDRPRSLIENLLPERLCSYFLFSGEWVSSLFADAEEDSLISSIEDLQGLTFASKSLERLKNYHTHLDTKLIQSNKANHQQAKASTALEDALKNKEKWNGKKEEAVRGIRVCRQKQKIINEKIQKSKHVLVKEKNKENQRIEKLLQSNRKDRDRRKEEIRGLLNKSSFHVYTFSLKKGLDKFMAEKRSQKIIPAPYDEQTLQNILLDELCICGRPVKEHSPEEEYIRSNFDVAGSEVQTKNYERIHNLLTEYAYENKKFRNKYDELQNLISELDDRITEDIGIKKQNELEIASAKKDDNIEELLNQQKELDKKIDKFTVSQIESQNQIKTFNDIISEQKKIISKHSGKVINKKVKARKEFIKKCCDILELQIEETKVNGREALKEKLAEICTKYNKKGEEFEFSSNESYIPRLKDRETGLYLPQNSGTLSQTAIYYALSLINNCKERFQKVDLIVAPGTIAPMVCDAVYSNLDPINSASVTEMLCTIPRQTILLVSSASYNGEVERVLDQSKKIGKTYYLQRKQPVVNKDVSPMYIKGKKYNAFIKDSTTTNSISNLI